MRERTSGSTSGTSRGPNLGQLPLHQACKYVQSEGVCERVYAHVSNNDMTAAMQEISAFAVQENITAAIAYSLIKQCCGFDIGGTSTDFPCEDVSQGWCQKYQQALPYGVNSTNMQGTVNGFISYANTFGYTLTYNEAYNTLVRCCEGVGVSSGDNPCEDDLWLNMPQGVASGQQTWWGKADYCARCAAINTNPTGNAVDGNFPATLTSSAPYWNANPNGTNYCGCCEDTSTTGTITLPPCNPEIQVVCQQIADAIANNDFQSFLEGAAMMAANWTSVTWAQAVQSASNMNTLKMEISTICEGCPVSVDTSSNFWDDAIGTGTTQLEQCKCCDQTGTPTAMAGFVAQGNCHTYNGNTWSGPNAGSWTNCSSTNVTLPCEGSGSSVSAKKGRGRDGGEYKNMSGMKTNHWIPLLVLGLSLTLGIYISEYATKKLIK